MSPRGRTSASFVPTALALRFLAMPSLSILWMQALAKLRGQILAKRQTLLRVNPSASVLKGATDKKEDRVYGKLTSIQGIAEGQRVGLTLGGDKDAIAIARKVFPVPAGPTPNTMSQSRMASR